MTGNYATILVHSNATKTVLNAAIIEINAPNVLLSSVRYLRFLDGQNCRGITFQNIKAVGRGLPFDAYIPANYTELFLCNIRVPGTNSVLGTGKFIFNTVVANN